MPVLFIDGFGFYSSLATNYTSPGTDCSIRLNMGLGRTGIGCLQINSASFGPTRSLGAHYTKVAMGIAASISGVSAGFTEILRFNQSSGTAGANIVIRVVTNGAIEVMRGSGDAPFQTSLGISAALVYSFGVYNYVEAICFFHATLGTVTVRVNGAVVLTLTNQNTLAWVSVPYTDAVQIMGAAFNSVNSYYADFYVLDWSAPPNNTLLGPVRVYEGPPDANGAVTWTPNAGTNWSNVNEIPPDGDTSYNSSGTIGQADQYRHPLNVGVPSVATLFAVQHSMTAKVDSGARSIVDDIGGVLSGGAVALPSGYAVFAWPYDLNPITGLAWQIADFPLFAGPSVSA